MYTLKPNGDIVTNEKASVVYDEKLRAFRVIIDLPKDGNYTIQFDVETIKRADGESVVSIQTGQTVQRPFAAVATEVITVDDPVTGETVSISVAGIATAIQMAFTRWLFNDSGTPLQ